MSGKVNLKCFWSFHACPSVSQLLHLSLKKSKVTSSEASALEMLDPFILLLLDCLDSMHVKVLALYVDTGFLLSPLDRTHSDLSNK